MYTILPLTLFFTAVTQAAVLIKRADPGPNVWTSPDGGNTAVRFGDSKVYVGDCSPESIIDTVAANCYGEGFCNSESWTMQCVQGDSASHTVTITAPEGQYQPWIKNSLIDAMKAALATDKVTESERITAMSGGGCVGCTYVLSPLLAERWLADF
jgi:hypothetical protein